MELRSPPHPGAAPPNLGDYDQARAAFTWGGARALLDGLPGGAGLNIAHEAVDRHAAGPRADVVAIRWLGKRGERRDLTYRDLALLHFTSGTTGKPKGAVHVHEAVVMHHIAGRYALDLRPGDVYWCTADPGTPRPPRSACSCGSRTISRAPTTSPPSA